MDPSPFLVQMTYLSFEARVFWPVVLFVCVVKMPDESARSKLFLYKLESFEARFSLKLIFCITLTHPEQPSPLSPVGGCFLSPTALKDT